MQRSIRCGLVLCLVAGLASAQYILTTQGGPALGSGLGHSAARVGDVNGDGVADYVVGAPAGVGTVRLFSGATNTVLHLFTGAMGSGFGHEATGVGDVDGDGFPDLAVGAPKDATNGMGAGAVFVYSGADYSLLHVFHGAGPDELLGWAVSGAGDVDGDGIDDILMGAPKADAPGKTDCGRVIVASGATGATLLSLDGNVTQIAMGASLATVGDVNSDGHADFVVGSPGLPAITGQVGFFPPVANFTPTVQLISGATGTVLFSDSTTQYYQGIGWSVAGLGDVNGDGTPDWAYGCRPYEGVGPIVPGCVRVFSGATGVQLHAFAGQNFDDFGIGLDSAGDVDGDGFDDILIGAPRFLSTSAGSQIGYVQVRSGATGAVLAQLNGSENHAGFGWAVAGVGDTDGDGQPEILVSSPHGSTALGPDVGSFQIFGLGAAPYHVAFASGDDQVTASGAAFAKPLVFEVTDTNGTPVANREVTLQLSAGLVATPGPSAQTDATGRASFSIAAAPGVIGGTKIVRAWTTQGDIQGVSTTLFVRWLGLFWTPQSSILVAAFLNDHAGVPILFAVDVPQPAVPTAHGVVHTSILNPQPTLALLDGTGLFALNPTMVANPNWIRVFNVPPAAVAGATSVFQVYGVDLSYPFPQNVFVSNAVTIAF